MLNMLCCPSDQVPVYKGAHAPLLQVGCDGVYHHGKNGMGGVTDEVVGDIRLLQSEHAVNTLVRLARKHKGKLTANIITMVVLFLGGLSVTNRPIRLMCLTFVCPSVCPSTFSFPDSNSKTLCPNLAGR